jgi:periplasmic divalent cation tolerance protein
MMAWCGRPGRSDYLWLRLRYQRQFGPANAGKLGKVRAVQGDGWMTDLLLVLTTTPSRAEAERIADRLVEEGLAACVQVAGPIWSVYRWEGKLERSEEWRCQAKCLRECYPQVEAAIRTLHPYQVPEIVAVPVAGGYEAYLTWLRQESGPAAGESG